MRENIAGSAVAGFDETGFRVEGKLHWVHCARTGKYTLLMVHPRRGKQAMAAMGVLPAFAGVAVHDAWAPYDNYAGAGHQLCCAHVLRELQAVTDAASEGQWCWAAQAADALAAMQKLASEAAAQDRGAVDPAALIHAYRSAALIGASQTAARPGKLMRKHHALARRLIDRQDDYLRFTRDFRVPPDKQRLRARHPDGQAETESIRLPAHNGRRPAVLRDPQRRVAPAHCCAGAPSGPRMHVIRARGPSKPLGAAQVVCCITVFPASRGSCLLRLQVACTRCVRLLRAAVGVSWWTR